MRSMAYGDPRLYVPGGAGAARLAATTAERLIKKHFVGTAAGIPCGDEQNALK